MESLSSASHQESLRLAALLARSLITKQEKRFLRMRFLFCSFGKDCCSKSRQSSHRMFPQSYLQRKRNDKIVAKKKFFRLPKIFCVLIAESVVAKNEEEYCADSFKTNDFPQKLSLPLSHMKLQ